MADSKIVPYRKRPHLNIGIVTFLIIFLYLIFNVFSYFTTEHISTYEVEQGTIAENTSYQGLILRTEQIVTSPYSGNINYYLKDSSKAGVGTLVYSVDESGSVYDYITENTSDVQNFCTDELSLIAESVSEFKQSYNNQNYASIYSFEDSVNGELMELLNLSALESVRENAANLATSTAFHLESATTDGIVVYYTDGYESVTPDTFTPKMLQALNYSSVNLKANTGIQSGSAAYKLITDEHWYIIIQIDESIYTRLSEDSVVKIRFKEDGETSYANYSFREIDGSHFMILALNNSMIRYANERYTEIELLLDEQSGLKIPNSAIIEKDFFVVPKEYFGQGGDSSDYGLLKQTMVDGEKMMEFVATDLYYETETDYYICEDSLRDGDVIQMPNSTQTYVLHDVASLKGVYNINKGYAVFKKIEILYQNAEYAIVKMQTSYGLSLYDHIALDGSKIEENSVVHS